MTPYVVITRPEPQASEWTDAFLQAGLQAITLPLIQIQALSIHNLDGVLDKYQAWMFVSPAAVEHFFSNQEAKWESQKNHSLRYWATGQGTVAALEKQGIPLTHIDAPAMQSAQFDSQSLWQVIAPHIHAYQHVLILRGASHTECKEVVNTGSGNQWLTNQLKQCAIEVAHIAAYTRNIPQWDADQYALAKASAINRAIWLFTSSESLGNLAALCPTISWTQTPAIATHPNIAKAARLLGFYPIVVTKPSLPDVLSMLRMQCG